MECHPYNHFSTLLEHVAKTDDDTTVAAVCTPLIQEIRRRNCRVWNTEVSRVSEIEEIGPELQTLALADSRVLQDSEINIVDSVRTQGVSSHIANSLRSSYRGEQRSSARLKYFFNTHRGKIERRVQVWSDGIAHQR